MSAILRQFVNYNMYKVSLIIFFYSHFLVSEKLVNFKLLQNRQCCIVPNFKEMAENFDPCECVCSTQWAMRRLLTALRSSQQYCSDMECLVDPANPSGTGADGSDQNSGVMYMMIAWVLIAFLLFFMRPQSLRRTGDEKPRDNNGPGPNNQPPAIQ